MAFTEGTLDGMSEGEGDGKLDGELEGSVKVVGAIVGNFVGKVVGSVVGPVVGGTSAEGLLVVGPFVAGIGSRIAAVGGTVSGILEGSDDSGLPDGFFKFVG